MPYPPEHKAKTRAKIVASARALFNRHGFDQVTIDQVMARAGLTRGGFYYHFTSKEQLHGEAVSSIAGCSPFSREVARSKARGVERSEEELAHLMVDMYLADDVLANVDDQCPLYALPSDVARSGRVPRAEYTKIVERMTGVLGRSRPGSSREAERRALATLALCVGAMVLARTTQDAALGKHVRAAARHTAHALLSATAPRGATRRAASPRGSGRVVTR